MKFSFQVLCILKFYMKNCTWLRGDKWKEFRHKNFNLWTCWVSVSLSVSLSPLPMIKQQKNWSVVIAGPDRILGQLLTKEGNLFPIRPGEDYQLISSHNDKVIV